eukprot:3430325-Rhodomonas_salina.1
MTGPSPPMPQQPAYSRRQRHGRRERKHWQQGVEADISALRHEALERHDRLPSPVQRLPASERRRSGERAHAGRK